MKILKVILLILLLLVLFFFGKGMLTPSVFYESEVNVDKPVEEAWAVMTDTANMANWIEGYRRSELISGTENTVGAVTHVFVVNQGQETMMKETLTAISPPNLIGMNFSMDFMDMDYEMILTEKAGQTHILTKSTTKGNGLFAKSMISFMPGTMKAQEDANLVKLKTLIEGNTKNYFPEPVNMVQ